MQGSSGPSHGFRIEEQSQTSHVHLLDDLIGPGDLSQDNPLGPGTRVEEDAETTSTELRPNIKATSHKIEPF